jgi:dTDP-4-dehydrorhamnose reductase
MRIAVIGANGQLGSDVCEVFHRKGDEVFRLTHDNIEVSSIDSVRTVLEALRPDVVVNTAAMHNVEHCELDPQRAYAVNALGPRNLAMVARDLRCVLVHISTDYVFDGSKSKPYVESDPPLPLNVYGNAKLAGEAYVRTITEKHFVLRTSALYGRSPCRAKGGQNFVDLMLKLARERDELRVVADEVVSPTSTAELAEQIVVLSQSDSYGLYHATAEGTCSWYEFAREIFRATNTKVNLKVAAPDEFPHKVPRPKYSVLENLGLKAAGLNVFKAWPEGLESYLADGRRPLAMARSKAIS